MEQDRKDFFKQLTDDAKKSLDHDSFTVSEIKEIIAETPLTQLDRDIAYYRYCECMTFEEIADKLGYDIRTIRSHLPSISISLKTTCTKLFIKIDK